MKQRRQDTIYQAEQMKFTAQARALVSLMTVDEAASQLLHESPAIERLQIPAYNWWNEGLHGVAKAGIATVFPQAIGMAATFDDELVHQEAEVIATEARAKYNAAQRRGDRGIYKGLTMWSPNINIFRDPRWGRGQETYGEDPYLTGRFAKAFITGLQGDMENGYLKVAACAKHFAVHSGPEALRHRFNSKVSAKDLRETYLPAFHKAVTEAGVEAVMTAYNRLDGVPCCANATLLQAILREEWGFTGHVVSDYMAVKDVYQNHEYVDTPQEAASISVQAGCDLNCGCTYEALMDGYREGLITENEIREAAVHVFTTRYKLGMFDEQCSYRNIPLETVECQRHLDKALQVAEQSIVLLKNDGILPLDRKTTMSIAVIGPNAYSVKALYGNYHGESSHWITNLDGIRMAADERARIYYAEGCKIGDEVDPSGAYRAGFAEALEIAQIADVTILCLGLNSDYEGEEGDAAHAYASGDRKNLLLPPVQVKLLEEVLALGRKVIVVLNSGSCLDLSRYEDGIDALIECWYSGTRGGEALGEVIFGKVNPSGRLPITFYYNDQPLPEFTNYSMKGRTYRYLNLKPYYPFGYGLSYTSFKYSNLDLYAEDNGTVDVTVEVHNTGNRDAVETVQVYVKYDGEAYEKPKYHLAEYRKVLVAAGRSVDVNFHLDKEAFYSYLGDGSAAFLDGSYTIYAGGSQPDARSEELLGVAPLSGKVSFHE